MIIASKYFVDFNFQRNAVKIILFQFCLIAFGVIVSFLDNSTFRILFGLLVFIISLFYSLNIINSHSNFKNLITSKFEK